MPLSGFSIIFACCGESTIEIHNNSDILYVWIFLHYFISRYRPSLSGSSSLTSLHLVAPQCVLLVSAFQGPAVFAWIGTHSVCPTVICKITVDSTTTAIAPIHVVLCTASSLTAIIGFVCGIHVLHILDSLRSLDVHTERLQHWGGTSLTYFSELSKKTVWTAPKSSELPACDSTHESPAQTWPSCGLSCSRCELPLVMCRTSRWCQITLGVPWLRITRSWTGRAGYKLSSLRYLPVPEACAAPTDFSFLEGT